jgi:hypothetical protein
MARPDVAHRQAGSRSWVQAGIRVGLCVLVVMTMGIEKGVAPAAEWSAAPSVSARGVYNSNLLLRDGNHEVVGYWMTPAVKFKGATEALAVEADIGADFVHYYGDVDREFTNLRVPLRTSYRLDRHTLGFEGGFTRDNTLRGELEETGLVLSFTQRNLWTAMPTWRMGITERLSWQSGYQFMDVRYQDGLRLGLVDYQVHGGTAGFTYNVRELDQLHVTGEYTSVRMPFIGLSTVYYGLQGGWTHDFGHQVIGSISGGGRLLSATQDLPAIPGILGILLGRTTDRSITSQEVVWVYRASLRKQFERAMVQIAGSREINPSGFGRILQNDRASAALSHELTERLRVSMDGSLNFVSFLSSNVVDPAGLASLTIRFFSVTPSLTWKVAEWWTLEVSYSYRERAVESLDQRNDSHSMFIMLTYGGEKWSVSR